MGRSPCCDKEKVKRGPWSPDEDCKLKSYIHHHGPVANWIALPHKIGLKRCGKSCRLRWLNYLRPNIKHGGFSEEEDRIICSLYVTIGSRWSIIAAQLPGRTDNDIKNYWNTSLKKKLILIQQPSSPKVVIQNQLRRCSYSTSRRTAISSSASHDYHRDWPVPVLQTSPAATLNNQLMIKPLRTLLLKLGGRFDEAHTTSTNNYYNAGTGTGTGTGINNNYEYHHHQSVDNYHHVSTSSSSSADNGGCVNNNEGILNVDVYPLEGQNCHDSLGGDRGKKQQGLDDDQLLYFINGSGGDHDHIYNANGWEW